ncbi:hypothetical protein CEK25_009204 [Fusarium fujikuroi]|nr:hypothetical protein CEK25_009204 [Fusarium fujikuroi]
MSSPKEKKQDSQKKLSKNDKKKILTQELQTNKERKRNQPTKTNTFRNADELYIGPEETNDKAKLSIETEETNDQEKESETYKTPHQEKDKEINRTKGRKSEGLEKLQRARILIRVGSPDLQPGCRTWRKIRRSRFRGREKNLGKPPFVGNGHEEGIPPFRMRESPYLRMPLSLLLEINPRLKAKLREKYPNHPLFLLP